MIKIGAQAATIDNPVEHLTACHRRIEDRLDTLVRAADYLETDPGTAWDAIRKSLKFLDLNGAMHTRDEEDSLFPRLRGRISAEQHSFLTSLETQHEEADAVLIRLKQIVNAPDIDADEYRLYALRLRVLYREHIGSEETVLVAMASEILSEEEKAQIAREMRNRRNL